MFLLRKFCCVLQLRTGCYIIAVLDLVINLNIIIFTNKAQVTMVERAMTICHCIGCSLLFIGALVVSTLLLVFYLITCVVNTAISLIIIIVLAHDYAPANLVMIIVCFTMVFLNTYSWYVVFSYYRQLSVPYTATT
ncbi:uncharacterized protein LOC111592241 [Drosophila hydei]|uniref:Uncharacterized protein LOC111592241 n=1 Tax=Drosophila hydei TaxID=7224 RepID=A0A6J1L5H8_DROHY|nr:uncharacterized protein LOC111592241 [Drosophila hydei]